MPWGPAARPIGFGEAIGRGYRRCLTFSGRAGRPEFWYFALYVLLGMMVAGRVDGLLVGYRPGPVSGLFHLVGGFPLLAGAWRRMHDTGRSGLYVIYPAIVLVGTTTFFGFLAGVMPGDPDQALGTLRETAGAIGAVVAMVAVFVLMISPLLVIWWLTRPGERQANRWGPPVA